MPQELLLQVSPEIAANESLLYEYVAKTVRVSTKLVQKVVVLKRSIDARQKAIKINLKVSVYLIDEEFIPQKIALPDYQNVSNQQEVIVVGAGHAGCEAANAAAKMGSKVLLLTMNMNTIAQMSCNPAMGGVAKGQIVREIDALGGAMAIAADKGGIQFRTLNSSKGPAVRATRAQADRQLYRAAIRQILENQPNLSIFQQSCDDLIVENDRVTGVVTQMGLKFKA